MDRHRDRGIDQSEATDPMGMPRRKGKADHVTDIMRYQIGTLDFESVEHASDISGLRLLSKPEAGLDERPSPRRSGTTTV